MTKFIPFLVLSFIFLNVQVFAADENTSAVAADENTYNIEEQDDLNFNNHSYYISDEQLQDAKEIDEIDDKSSFIQKIINSSHFSSDTATRTWIPINKVQE